ncbi:MAG: Gfo/Idh/MocA family oxidoreductase [Candidatus Accumulibacter sp.]|jgi:predicted dehydrogenase|nr:Gfo/Idh/MocA family oxidoreductase [Accumulibacter sp.]
MSEYPVLRFGVVGLDHRHIFDQVRGLLDIGGECAGYWTEGHPLPEKGFIERFPHIPRVDDRARLFEDPTVRLITCAAIPCDRAALAVEAMRCGKDFMADKPGMTTLEQLDAIRQTQRQTGRIYSVNFTEHFEVRAVTTATELVRSGAIGRVIQTLGLGPHRFNRHTRAPWFFDPKAYGGILADIGSHQIEQFLHFTASDDARIVLARCGNLGHPDDPGFQDFGEMVLTHEGANGYVRLDWFTPDSLGAWGDGRFMILGTEGYIELRKYIDIAGRSGADHLFLVNHGETRYIDCSRAELPYYSDLRRDVFERTETAMTHAHCFKTCELALTAQAMAARI